MAVYKENKEDIMKHHNESMKQQIETDRIEMDKKKDKVELMKAEKKEKDGSNKQGRGRGAILRAAIPHRHPLRRTSHLADAHGVADELDISGKSRDRKKEGFKHTFSLLGEREREKEG